MARGAVGYSASCAGGLAPLPLSCSDKRLSCCDTFWGLEARRLALGDRRGRIVQFADDDMPLEVFEEGYQSAEDVLQPASSL